MTNFYMGHGKKYYDTKNVMRLTGLSYITIMKRERDGAFPPSIKYKGAREWLKADIDKYLLTLSTVRDKIPLTYKKQKRKPGAIQSA